MVTHAAGHAGARSLVFSLKMNERELGQRLLAAEARIDSTRLRNGDLTDVHWARITTAVSRLQNAPISIDDNPHLTIMECERRPAGTRAAKASTSSWSTTRS